MVSGPDQNRPGVEVSAAMSRAKGSTVSNGIFDKTYYDDTLADRIKDGSIGEAPVIPGTGLFMPVATAAWKDKGMFRLDVPKYTAHLCTGCMECAVVCPDAAIPNTVHDIHDLLLTAIGKLDITEQHKSQMSNQVFPLTKAVRDTYRNLIGKDESTFSDIVKRSLASLDTSSISSWASLQRDFDKMIDVLEGFPVARTRPFFDAMEKNEPGSGGLYSVNIDPWKCTGCLECVDVCGPGALAADKQSSLLQSRMSQNFEFLSKLPNTPARFTESAIQPGGESKRLILDHDNYYAMTGGHGACRGCGEVTAIRMLTATNRAIHEKKRKTHIHELDALIANLKAKLDNIPTDENDPDRGQRMQKTIDGP